MIQWKAPTELRPAGLALVMLIAALVWMHPEITWKGAVYSSSDTQAAAAFQSAGQRSLEAGEYPYWNPFVFTGMPSFASLAYNPGVYPLTAPLHAVREFLNLPPMTWLLFHLWLMGVGMTGYLRWRGASWASATVGGVLFMSLPKILAWSAYGHGTKVGTFAWFPWAIWTAEAALRKSSLRWAAALALVLSMQLLRAHVQIVYYTVMTIAIWVGAQAWAELRGGGCRSRLGRSVVWVGLAGLLALGVAATLYLPVLEYQGWSIRGASGGGAAAATSAYDYATSWSMRWSEIATFWWPTAVGYGRAAYVGGMPFTDYPHYLGLPLLLLAAFGVATRRDRWSWAAMSVVLLSTLVALGKYGPVYRLFYDILPGFQKFRVPVMILCIQHFAVVVLAAGGLDSVAERLRGTRPRWMGLPLAAGLVFTGVVLVGLGSVGSTAWQSWLQDHWSQLAQSAGRGRPPFAAMQAVAEIATGDALRLGLVLVALVGVGVGMGRRRLSATVGIALIGMLLFIDIWRVDLVLLHPERGLPSLARQGQQVVAAPSEAVVRHLRAFEEYTAPSELSTWLLEQSTRPRVWPILGPRATDNVLAARGIVSLGGYYAAKLKVYEDLRERLYAPGRPEVKLANLLAAEFVLSPQSFSEETLAALRRMGLDLGSEAEYVGEEGVVYRNLSSGPRAWLVHRVELEEAGQTTTGVLPSTSVLDRVVAPSFAVADRAIVSGPPDPLPAPASGPERVELRKETFHRLEYEVESTANALVVFAEIWYPQWHARVDGKRVELLRADLALRAVAVPAGQHVVELEYVAGSHRVGEWIRALSLLVILAGWLFPLLLRRRTSAPGEGAEGS